MRELAAKELSLVAGSGDSQTCTPETALNDYNGIRNPSSIGRDLIDIYEGVVAATSHVIERVALALND